MEEKVYVITDKQVNEICQYLTNGTYSFVEPVMRQLTSLKEMEGTSNDA
jgi:hypothetical protein